MLRGETMKCRKTKVKPLLWVRDDLPTSEDAANNVLSYYAIHPQSSMYICIYVLSFSRENIAPSVYVLWFFLLSGRDDAFSRIFIMSRGKLRLQWNSLYNRCTPHFDVHSYLAIVSRAGVLTGNIYELKWCNHAIKQR